MFQRSGILLTAALLLILISSTAFGEAIVTSGSDYYGYQTLPIVSIQTTINVEDQVATTTIDQTFFSNGTDSTATYHFPLPPRATITGFGIWRGEEIQYFDLTPSPDDTTSHQGSANMPEDLRDFLGNNPFVAPLFGLPEGDFTIRLEYAELMDYSFGVYTEMYPLGTQPYLVAAINNVTVDVFVHSQRNILEAEVGNYAAEILYQTSDSLAIHFADEYCYPNQEFMLNLTVNQEEVGMWVMPHREPDSEVGHFLAVLEPGNVSPDDISHKSFTFVIDRSGSMAGNRIEEAKQAAVYCVQNMLEGDSFNLVSFATSVTPWQPEPVPVSPENVDAAITYINALTANGSTNLNAAMQYALNQDMGTDVVNQILLLSDGFPTEGVTDVPTILSNIRDANTQDVSIFTVGVGPEGNFGGSGLDFLRMIAYENHGLSIHIVPGTVDISETIATFFTRFASPVLTDVTLDYGALQVLDNEIYAPAPYNLFAGSQTVIAGVYQGTESVTTNIEVTASVTGHDTTLTYGPFLFPDSSSAFAFVPRMWAIKKIDYWLAWMSANGEDEDIINMIIELSIRYGILTPYTNFDTDDPGDPLALGDDLNLAARTAAEGVYISWSPVNLAPDATFDIYRREIGSHAWLKLNTKPITTSSYLDRNAIPGVSYVYRVVMQGNDVKDVVEEITIQGPATPSFALESIYPNPFNERTEVRFQLATASRVKIEVYDILGRQVTTLWDGPAQVGRHAVSLDASRMASGVYFLRMQATAENGTGTVSRISRISLVK